MTERKKRYTPGPWEITDEDGFDGPVVGVPADDGGAYEVAETKDQDECTGHNAHLIAAAPELLNALEEARCAIQALIDDGYMGYVDLRSDTDAAIAKAYGEE